VILCTSNYLKGRKLVLALSYLYNDKQMPPEFRVIGFARREKTDDSWRTELRQALDQFSRTKPVDDKVWQEAIDFGNLPYGWIQVKGMEAFIEIDRATENKGALVKKFDNYIRFKQSGGYHSVFEGCEFRVLFITTTEERIEMLERLITSDDIWFCTMDEFLREPLDHAHWFALRGFYALPIAGKKEVSELQ
jgi:hypothetical protein